VAQWQDKAGEIKRSLAGPQQEWKENGVLESPKDSDAL
jgi:hypothetical protein